MRWPAWTWLAVLGAVLLAVPFVLPRYGLTLATEICIMALFAMSLGLLVGYAGLASLGHAAYFGIGAYTVALLGKQVGNMIVLIGAALLLSAAIACGSGALFIRASGPYFLMLTLAFGQVVYAVAFQWHGVTGGGDGMRVAAAPDLGFGALDRTGFYLLVAAVFLVCYLFLRRFVRSPAGVAVRGVKENETRMRALGYDTRRYKLLAFTIAGAIAGLAGALDAYYNRFVSPELAYWTQSGQVLIMVIIGGVGTLFGPALGAAFYVVVQNALSSYTERWPLIMGAIFVAFVLVGRGGILNLLIAGRAGAIAVRFRRRVETAR